MFSTIVYNIASSTGSAFNDLVAATDPEFSQRNSHYIFTEQFNLLATGLFGTGAARGRYQVPTWNAIAEDTIFNVNRGLEPITNSQLDWYVPKPKPIPINEEFQVQVFDNGAGTTVDNAVLWLGTDDWSSALPQGAALGNSPQLPVVVRSTGTTTWTLNGWTPLAQLTLSQSLRGGVYAVVGAVLQADDALAFRLVFPRQRLYRGRRLRPGFYCQNSIGDIVGIHSLPESARLGIWGMFHTFELPQLEVFGTAADSTAWTLFMWCVWMGEDVSVLNNWINGGQVMYRAPGL